MDVRLDEKAVWLTIDQMAILYGKSRSTINEHILNAYKEKEIEEEKTMRKIGSATSDILRKSEVAVYFFLYTRFLLLPHASK